MGSLETLIEKKALELGYEKCGIVRLGDLTGYDEMLAERMRKVPESAAFHQGQKRLTDLIGQYPWAKSVVVTVGTYGKYRIPKNVDGRVGKYYLCDGRSCPESEEYTASREMETCLQELGLKTATNRLFGIVGLRWAAMKAGLGVVRRNNFFYTESGSWVTLDAWLTDGDLELIQTHKLPPCPENCGRCIDACPSGSLSAPYEMSAFRCVSFLTTFGGRDFPGNPLAKRCGTWIYGCDACQDTCPMNHGKWKGEEEFPGLRELAPYLSPEKILELDDAFYRENIQPKFSI